MQNTRTAKRRSLRFNSLDDLLAEMGRLIQAESEGHLTYSGNWTLGQIFGHLAAWMSYPYDGFPMGKAPWFVRLIVGPQKQRFLTRGLPAGVRMPGVREGTYGVESLSTAEGAARLREAVERLLTGRPPVHPSPVFGPMSHDETLQANLRHAELHLSFVHSTEQP